MQEFGQSFCAIPQGLNTTSINSIIHFGNSSGCTSRPPYRYLHLQFPFTIQHVFRGIWPKAPSGCFHSQESLIFVKKLRQSSSLRTLGMYPAKLRRLSSDKGYFHICRNSSLHSSPKSFSFVRDRGSSQWSSSNLAGGGGSCFSLLRSSSLLGSLARAGIAGTGM